MSYTTRFEAMAIILAALFVFACGLLVGAVVRAIEKVCVAISRVFVDAMLQTIFDSWSVIRMGQDAVVMFDDVIDSQILQEIRFQETLLDSPGASENLGIMSSAEPEPARRYDSTNISSESPSSSSGWEMDSPGGRHSRMIHARQRRNSCE